VKNLILRYSLVTFILFSNVKGYTQDNLHLNFSKLYQLLENNSSTLKLDAVREDIAKLQTKITMNKRLPDLGISATAGYISNVGVIGLGEMEDGFYDMPHFSNSYRIEANYIVYKGGIINREIDIAKLQQRITSLHTEKDMQELKLLMSGYLLDLFTLGLQRKVYEQNIIQAQAILDKIKNQIRVGMALKSDQIRNELLVEEMKLQLLRVKNRISIVNNILTETLNLSVDLHIVPTDISLHQESQNPIDNWQQKALQEAPELHINAIETDISKKEVQQVKSEMLPKVSLYFENGLSRPFLYDIPAKDIYANLLNAGVRISYPLDELYKNKAKLDHANSNLDYVRKKQELAEEEIRKAVFKAFTLYTEAQQTIDSEQKKTELATENYRRISNSYYQQVALITDLTDASNQKLSSELQLVVARSQIIMRFLELKKITGQLN
jgi:outer membrane protein